MEVYNKENFVVVKISGQSVYDFTEGLQEPFYKIYMESMYRTSKKLSESIKNCKYSYTDSNEIILLLIKEENINEEVWENEVKNIKNIAKTLAILNFNRIFKKLFQEYEFKIPKDIIDLFQRKVIRNNFISEILDSSPKEMEDYFLLIEKWNIIHKIILNECL